MHAEIPGNACPSDGRPADRCAGEESIDSLCQPHLNSFFYTEYDPRSNSWQR